MSRLKECLENKNGNYIFPFFWQNGADEDTIRTELEKIWKSNVKAFCIEARPHPDFGGAKWWHDLDVIMEYAREHDMKVWLLDDDRFPTGHANKIFSDGNHPLSVRFLTIHNTDVKGPQEHAHMLVDSILTQDDKLIGIIACKRKSESTEDLDLNSAIDLTEQQQYGWLNTKIPDGLWRILVLYTTRNGNGKLDYFNILDADSVNLLLKQVYVPHYQHYYADYGKTFLGFFSDEPEFSNLPGYRFQAKIGNDMPFMPWSEELGEKLKRRWEEKYLPNLTALFHEVGKRTAHIRYEYMDEVTKQLKTAFSDQIAEWCRGHGVSHIGHIVEDDNVHGRLGCSTGHYYRSLSGMRMAGIDVVTQQIMPGMDQIYHQWVASNRDGEFFHYGLGKMGSSLAHIDPNKHGDALCEIFGAYGWQEGIGLMKWLADHMFSRGINHFVPHAFSMKPYPDPDCPPHFYAHGNQMQYEHFGVLMQYMNRVSHLFSEGTYPAEIAVLYHADAEWAGEAMLFQKPVRKMLENQLDCDVIPSDMLSDTNPYEAVINNGISCQNTVYRILIIPYCKYLPGKTAEFIVKHKNSIKILFIDHHPSEICEENMDEKKLVAELREVEIVSLDNLADRVRELIAPLVTVRGQQNRLRTYPYIGQDHQLYLFCFNEDTENIIEDEIAVRVHGEEKILCQYDSIHNQCWEEPLLKEKDKIKFKIKLQPGESQIYVIREKANANDVKGKPQYITMSQQKFIWKISYQWQGKTEWEELPVEDEDLPDLTEWAEKTKFNGILRYTTEIQNIEKESEALVVLKNQVDCADFFINGECQDRICGTPGKGRIHLYPGNNTLEIRLPLTPVFNRGDCWSSLTVLPSIGLLKKPEIAIEEKISE